MEGGDSLDRNGTNTTNNNAIMKMRAAQFNIKK